MSDSAISTGTYNNDNLQRNQQLAAVSSTDQQQQQPGVKRTLIYDDLNSLPAKKQNTNGDMAAMNSAVAGSVDVIQVPDNAVGLVIGRGGEQITSIQSQSGCRVQMAPDGGGTGYRPCSLAGTPHAIEHARRLITEIVSRAQANNGNGMGGGNAQFVTQQMLIPGQKCGLIIGKSGETIKNLQESIGVKMILIQENHSATMQPKPLRITGQPDKVEQAKRAVELLLSNDDRQGGGPGMGGNIPQQMVMPQQRSMGEVIVPRSAVGVIIGKGGETIKRLATESGAKIQFKPDDNPSSPERCATIQGTPSQIERATNMIWDLVQRSNGTTQQEMCLMHVPATKTGLVIGKGGETIKAINSETGAHVELSKDPPPNANEKVFVIKGSPYQIHLAQHAIRIKVGDVPPGTPAPVFQPMQMQGGFQPQFGAVPNNQFNPQQQWAAPANGFVQQNPQYVTPGVPTNQYYGQQPGGVVASQGQFVSQMPTQMPSAPVQSQQQYGANMAPQQQQPQYQQPMPANSAQQDRNPGQDQQNAGQPAINPSTGQPDYSAQWAQYYRSIGLHDQAALIEDQIRNAKRGQ